MSSSEQSQAHASSDGESPGPHRADKHQAREGPSRPGKSGLGAAAAMAQIRLDRLAGLHLPPTPEDQIRGLWLARAPSERRLTALRDLHDWLSANAPELLNGQADPQAYLLRLLAPDIESGRPTA